MVLFSLENDASLPITYLKNLVLLLLLSAARLAIAHTENNQEFLCGRMWKKLRTKGWHFCHVWLVWNIALFDGLVRHRLGVWGEAKSDSSEAGWFPFFEYRNK